MSFSPIRKMTDCSPMGAVTLFFHEAATTLLTRAQGRTEFLLAPAMILSMGAWGRIRFLPILATTPSMRMKMMTRCLPGAAAISSSGGSAMMRYLAMRAMILLTAMKGLTVYSAAPVMTG